MFEINCGHKDFVPSIFAFTFLSIFSFFFFFTIHFDIIAVVFNKSAAMFCPLDLDVSVTLCEGSPHFYFATAKYKKCSCVFIDLIIYMYSSIHCNRPTWQRFLKYALSFSLIPIHVDSFVVCCSESRPSGIFAFEKPVFLLFPLSAHLPGKTAVPAMHSNNIGIMFYSNVLRFPLKIIMTLFYQYVSLLMLLKIAYVEIDLIFLSILFF